MRVFSEVTVGYNPGPQPGRNQLRVQLSVLHSIEFLVLWRNIKEVTGSVNPKQDSKLIGRSGNFSILSRFAHAIPQGFGDFFRDIIDGDIFHALFVAVRALLFVTRGTAQI